jgi:hypothetical protein
MGIDPRKLSGNVHVWWVSIQGNRVVMYMCDGYRSTETEWLCTCVMGIDPRKLSGIVHVWWVSIQGNWVVMYMCDGYRFCLCFYDFSIGFVNHSDSMVFFAFHFILTYAKVAPTLLNMLSVIPLLIKFLFGVNVLHVINYSGFNPK